MNQQSRPMIAIQPNKYLLVALLVIFSLLSVHESLAHNHKHKQTVQVEDCQHCVISENSEETLHHQATQLAATYTLQTTPPEPTILGFLTCLFLSNRDPPITSYF